jgi:hypothetical protein
VHESYQPIAGLLSEFIILTDFKLLLLVLATGWLRLSRQKNCGDILLKEDVTNYHDEDLYSGYLLSAGIKIEKNSFYVIDRSRN